MFDSLEILNFRGFGKFRMNPLSRINLITGKNNSGKTSLLEATFLLATATTTRWPKRSTASTRPRRSTGAARGDRSMPSNTPLSNGWTGSIINACSAPSATSRPQRPKQITMPPARTSIWLHDSNVTASGKAGAVQPGIRCKVACGFQSETLPSGGPPPRQREVAPGGKEALHVCRFPLGPCAAIVGGLRPLP